MTRRLSIALSEELETKLEAHLLRADGQEDLCLVQYALSTGESRTTVLLTQMISPLTGERTVHRNASFTGAYVLRACAQAAAAGQGLALVHSHPDGTGWQAMSATDADAERSYADLVQRLTGKPFVGMTLAGDGAWSARSWQDDRAHAAHEVRVVGTSLALHWDRPHTSALSVNPRQVRTVSAWGAKAHSDIERLAVLVVGAGSVGLDVAVRLAATGIRRIGVMDFDVVKEHNLDRMIGASADDARSARRKCDVALREMARAATAQNPIFSAHDDDITTPEGLRHALDYDVIISCVDSSYPRAVMNEIAYSDLIPVIDGGIAIDVFPDGGGMRNATIRTHTVTPGRPCLQCIGQINSDDVVMDKQGLLDDASYIATTDREEPARQNVALLSVGVTAALLGHFVSLTARPGGRGVPAPLRYSATTHSIEHLDSIESGPNCPYERGPLGDSRIPLTRSGIQAGSSRT